MNYNKKISSTEELEHAKMELREAQAKLMEIEKEIILGKYTFPPKPSPDGYFHISVKDTTKKSGRKSISGKSIEELKNKVYDFEIGKRNSSKKTFQQVFEEVEQEKLRLVKSKDKLYSVQNTVARDYSEYKRFIMNTPIEHMYIEDISKLDIHRTIEENLTKHDLKAKGFCSLKAIFRNVFKKACYYGYIKENPFEQVDLSFFENMVIEDVDIKNRVHSSEDIQRMFNYLHDYQSTHPSYIPAYALEFQIATGFRRAEIPPLRWDDIEDNVIYVWQEQLTVKRTEKEPEHFVIVGHTKNRKNRAYPIFNDLKPILQKLDYVHHRYYPNSKYLFPAQSANGVITNNTVYNFYRRMCKKLGIKICKDFIKGTHSFRRTAMDDIMKICGSAEIASEILGNSPKVAIENYYTGIGISRKMEVLNQRNLPT